MIGPYRVLHQIGSGVLGPVFRVVDPDADTIVALKLFKLDWPPEQAHALAGGLQTLIETLPAHPSIVVPLAAGLDGATVWLAQELAAADGLDARMRRRTAVGAEALVAVLRQVASAVDTAAEAGWRHGALHPRDVLVDTTGRVRVTGIGIAQVVERFGAKPPRRRPYAAPERAAGQPWDVRADVFALAVIAAEWLAPRRGRAGGEPLVETLERAGFDGEAATKVLEAATAARPDDRPPTAVAFVEALASTIDPVRLARTRTPAPGLLLAAMEAAQQTAPVSAAGPEDAGPDTPAGPPADEATLITAMPASPAPDDLRLRDAPEVEGAEDPRLSAARAGDVEFRAEDAVAAEPALVAEAATAPAFADGVHDGESTHRASEPGPVVLAVPHTDPWGFSPPEAAPATAGAPLLSTSQWLVSLAAVLLAGLAIGFLLGRWSVTPLRPAAGPAPAAGADLATATTEVRDEPVLAEPPSGPAAGQPVPSSPAAAPAPAGPAAPRSQVAAPRPVDGRLVVRSTPSGARVRVDGRDRGATPLTLRDLDAGEYRLEIARQGYVAETRRVTISGRQPSATVDVRLRAERAAPPAPAGRASLEFVTRPAGARVLVDGREVGVTPFKMAEVSPGARSVRFELAGHAPWASIITLAPGESRRVTASLEPRR